MLQFLTMRHIQAKWTGNFETLGSKFSNETAKLAACVLRYFNQVPSFKRSLIYTRPQE